MIEERKALLEELTEATKMDEVENEIEINIFTKLTSPFMTIICC